MMLRLPLIAGLAFLAMRAVGQYPLTRTVDLRGPLRETEVRQLAQDEQDLLWVAHEKGLTCSDGRRAVQVFDAGTDRVMLMSEAAPVLAFLQSGILLRCAHQQVDTLWTDTSFRRTPPRAMRTAADGTLWIGTYGGGLVLRKGERSRSIGIGEGLSDDHVNALAPLAGGRMAVATDQGIDVLDAAGVLQHHFTEEQGLPDNLVLSLAVDPSGMLWAGTHHGGIFRLDAADPQAAPVRYGCADAMGPIRSLRWASDRIWAGTEEHGVLVCDAQDAAGDRYSEAWARGAITAITVIADGSVWWCSGKSTVTRAFAEAELFTEHEGVDLRRATALCITPDRRICVATRQGLLLHPIAFQPEQRLKFLPLPIQPDRPILALEATADGSLWAGTFGDGVFRIEPDGKVRHYTEAQQLCNANVMAMDASGDRNAPVWFATLGGVCLFDPVRAAFRTVAIPGTRFVYDVQVLADGAALLATDGNGVVRVDPDGNTSVLGPAEMQRASFYSLCVDHQGTAWACGPGTGLCAVEGNSLRKRAELSGDVFGIQPYTDGVVAFGRDATPFFNAQRGNALDWAAFFDLEGLQAELNAMVADAGSLWVATDRGLLRLHPDPARLEQGPAVVVTRWTGGNEHLDPDSAQVLAYDHNDIELRFAAPYYALTGGDLRFEYRLPGSDTTLRTTTDDRLFWPRLPAGDHRFAIRAVVARGTVQGPWTELRFRIQLPWWRTPWAIGAGVLLVTLLFYAFIRTREERLRFRDRVEQDKARFELEVLRSQVNPHFLFNSFNTLTALIEVDRDKAVEHVGQLSDFYREILQVRDKELVPLHEELRLVDTYFQLEKGRFGDRIGLETDIEAAALPLLLPPLTLQMLVENALKHNAAEVNAPLIVHVVAKGRVLEVWNMLRPRATAVPGTGFGVESIRKRYRGLSDRPVEVGTSDGRFTVRIPLLAVP